MVGLLGYNALKADPAPRQVVSYDKCKALAQTCIMKPENFCEVAVIDGEVVGALSALVHEQMVFERKQASVVQWYCTVPSYGGLLMRRFVNWAKPQRKIKCIAFTEEIGMDERIGRVIGRMGFQQVNTWVYWK